MCYNYVALNPFIDEFDSSKFSGFKTKLCYDGITVGELSLARSRSVSVNPILMPPPIASLTALFGGLNTSGEIIMTQKQFFVYIHARPNTTDIHGIFYVGKGVKSRLNSVIRKHNQHHTRIVNKYGKENIIIRRLACESEQHAFNLEIQMIAKLREMGVSLTNATNGGEGASGAIVSEETKRKMSESAKRIYTPERGKQISERQIGRLLTEQQKAKISASNKGRVPPNKGKKMPPELVAAMAIRAANISDETREKMSKANKGRIMSPEARAKISEFHKQFQNLPEVKLKKSLAAKKRVFSEETLAKMKESKKNISQETRDKMSLSAKKNADKTSELHKGKKHTAEARAKMSAAHKNRTPEQCEAISLRMKKTFADKRAVILEGSENMKICSRCKVKKSCVLFGANKSSRDGLCYYCRECSNEWSRNKYKASRTICLETSLETSGAIRT